MSNMISEEPRRARSSVSHPPAPDSITETHNSAPLARDRQETKGVDGLAFWLLAAQHFSRQAACNANHSADLIDNLSSSTWGDRSAEFAFPIYLIEIFVDTLLPASVYGFVTTFAGILLSGAVGHQIDIRPRLRTIRTCIAAQKLCASLCYGLFLVLFARFSSMDSDTRRLMLAVITICGCGLKLATVGMNVCVERDWVMTIAASCHPQPPAPSNTDSVRLDDSTTTSAQRTDHIDQTLLQLNTTLRRIDLICKLVAPLFVSLLTSTVGYLYSAVILLSIGLVTAVFECVFVGIVFRKFPALAVPRPRIEESRTDWTAQGLLREGKKWAMQQSQDWVEFVRHPIFLSSLSISLLYFNVLSFNSPFISYLKSQTDFSDPLIAGMRGLCVATGLFGTFVMPWMEKRIGLIRTGSWAIWSEALTLVPTVLCLYIGTDERQRPYWNSALLFTGMALSRIGLWSFDLTQLTQLQKALAHHPRQNTISALQYSLQNIFDLAHYGLTLGWNRPAEFKYAATVSIGAVFIAALVYVVGYARPLRGHVFHFDKLRSKLATAIRQR